MKTKILALLLVFSSFIANAQTKKITWVPWAKVPVEVKNRLKTIKTYGTETIYKTILENMQEGDEAFVAIIDLDGDGKPGYAIAFNGSYSCGNRGCSVSFFEKDGKTSIELVDHWEMIKPANGGVFSSTGKFFALKSTKLN